MLIDICEVGPRDGLQNLKRLFSVDERVALINRLSAAGARHIEAVSFVNPARVPQMADAEAVLAAIDRPAGLSVAGLVMNERGVGRALRCALDELRFVIVASETFSLRNQAASVGQTLEAFKQVCPMVHAHGIRMTAVIAAAFGCPFEGHIPQARVVELVSQAVTRGAETIILADTIGAGVPTQVAAMLKAVRTAHPGLTVGCHFHNTRNMGFANAYAALVGGATILDASIGGLGGCPFAPRATGNIATEDLLYLLGGWGTASGWDHTRAIEVVQWLRDRVPNEITGRMADAGWFPG